MEEAAVTSWVDGTRKTEKETPCERESGECLSTHTLALRSLPPDNPVSSGKVMVDVGVRGDGELVCLQLVGGALPQALG